MNEMHKHAAKALLLAALLVFSSGCSEPNPSSVADSHGASSEKTPVLEGYFVDSVNGNDGNSGTSSDQPWKSVDKISAITFHPGDHIYFKRGSSYSEGFQINGDGTAERPITVSAYGTGDAPRFTNTDDSDYNGNCIQLNGDYQVLEHLYFYGTNPSPSENYESVWKVGAIKVNLGADHTIIRNNEVVDAPIGINSYSDHALITENTIHDCNRVLNVPNWGPLGIRIGIGNTEISYNTIHNLHSIGGTWGGDGGAIEIDDGRNHHKNISIHHNKSSRNMGFIEMSYGFDICADPKQLAVACQEGDCRSCDADDRIFQNVVIAYNEASDFRTFTQIWGPLAGSFIENNTIVRTIEHPEIESNVFCEFDPDKLAVDSPTTYRNNLVVVVSANTREDVDQNRVFLGYPMAPFVHSNNLFFNASGGEVVMSGNATENTEFAEGELFADPLLVDLEGGDYHLTAGSPAREQGVPAHFAEDLDGNPVGDPPDIGAYQFQLNLTPEAGEAPAER